MPLDMEGSDASTGRPARVSSLQPLNRQTDMIAAYAFNEPAASCNLDRSGKGLDFVTSNLASELANVPDLIPGKAAVIGAGSSLYSTCPAQCRQYSQNWTALYGAATVVMRVWITAPENLNFTNTFCYCNAQDTTNGSCALQFYAFQRTTPNRWVLGCYSERNKVGQSFGSANLTVPTNDWAFISWRRSATGRVTLGAHLGRYGQNASFESFDFGQLPLSSVTTSMSISFAQTHWGADHSSAAWADFAAWGVELTDAELAAQAYAPMAGYGGP